MTANSQAAPAGDYIDIPLGSRAVEWETRADGSILMSNREALRPYPRVLTERLVSGAAVHPDRIFIAERGPDGEWAELSWRGTLKYVMALGEALLSRGLSAERPVAILSPGSIAHALVALACTHAGIPYCPVSPAYSTLAKDFSKLDHVLGLLTPGLVFVEDAGEYDRVLKGTSVGGFEVVAARRAQEFGATPLGKLLETVPTKALEDAHAAILADDVNKVLFTSGSTGMPKGVTNTHRMVCANEQMFAQAFPAIAARPPVLLSWLPWHHTSGANMILRIAVFHGGTLHIDDGKPVPALMGRTLRNLREVSPTAYFSAPSAFHELIPVLRADEVLRKTFFRDLSFFFYSGSSMPEPLIAAMDEIAIDTVGARVPFFSTYGSTESSPVTLAVNWPEPRGGLAGLPVPGAEFKMVEVDGKWEACQRGPNVTPGYWRQPELTAKAIDDEGFYHFGDAVAPLDPDDLSKGLRFDGRLGENFKLLTGTWVSVGALRDRLVTAASPLIKDAAITGENRSEVGALVFLDPLQARRVAGLPDGTADAEAFAHPGVRQRLQQALDGLAAQGTGSSTFVARLAVMEQALDAAAGELTDKGSVSQKTLLKTRAAEIEALHGGSPAAAHHLVAKGR